MATLNARAGAVAAPMGAAGGLALNYAGTGLAPLSLLCLAAACFGVWAFADEMDVRRPLNRAGLVAYMFAAGSKVVVLLDASSANQFLILYAFALLTALLFWSIALLHRDGTPKLAGAAGALGAVAPLALLVAGHLFVGAGAALGVSMLYQAGANLARLDLPVIALVEGTLLVWSVIVATLLWTGQIRANA
jgi:hypothetical protein